MFGYSIFQAMSCPIWGKGNLFSKVPESVALTNMGEGELI